VIYLTGEVDGATLERAKATEPLGFLLKPIEEKRLYSTIEIALYKHRMDRASAASNAGSHRPEKHRDARDGDRHAGPGHFHESMAEKLTGWKSSEAAAKPLAEIYQTVNVETRERLDAWCRRPCSRGRGRSGQPRRADLAKRTETLIDDSAAPIRDGAGNITGIVLTFRDVSERQRAEQPCNRARNASDAGGRRAGLRDFHARPSRRVTSWNGGAERLLGYHSAEILGADLSRFFTAPDVKRGKPEQYLELAKSKGRAEDEGWRVRKTVPFPGQRHYHRTARRPGAPGSLAQVTRDITGMKQAEKQLKDSREELRALAAYLQSVREEERTRIAARCTTSWPGADRPENGPRLAGEEICRCHQRAVAADLAAENPPDAGIVDEIISAVRKMPRNCGRVCWMIWVWRQPSNGRYRISKADRRQVRVRFQFEDIRLNPTGPPRYSASFRRRSPTSSGTPTRRA